tara:strand:- start:3502 stop:4377 length:876 start_codon:yes stop_codon:yes gene_type:complete
MSFVTEIYQDFENLAQTINKLSGDKEVVYIPNPGNFGDGLIRYATKQFLKDFNINHWEVNVGYGMITYQLLPYLINKDKYFFVIGGGGGWCDAYNCGYRIAKKITNFTSNFLVLPSTFDINISKISGTLYSRDKYESLERNPSKLFCHDMAFYLTTVNSEKLNSKNDNITPHIGFLMRTDKESANLNFPQHSFNIDISLLGDHMSNGDKFLKIVSQYDEIYTDRLHVCIASIIMGIDVNLFPGSYFKIKRIYESSIKPYFDAVSLFNNKEDCVGYMQVLNSNFEAINETKN